jgi:hypothetical protein
VWHPFFKPALFCGLSDVYVANKTSLRCKSCQKAQKMQKKSPKCQIRVEKNWRDVKFASKNIGEVSNSRGKILARCQIGAKIIFRQVLWASVDEVTSSP